MLAVLLTMSSHYGYAALMQLNIYVPQDKNSVIEALERAAQQTGRPKNELVLEALEGYLQAWRPEVGRFHLGARNAGGRQELYEGRLSR